MRSVEYISLAEFVRRNKGMGTATVRKMCEKGELSSYKSEGGHWYIKMSPSSNEVELAELRRENELLKQKLSSILSIASLKIT